MPGNPRRLRGSRSRALTGAFLAVSLAALAPGHAESAGATAVSSSPLAGMVSVDGVPLGNVTLLVRGVSRAVTTLVRTLKTDPDGTFCIGDVPAGVYSVVSVVPGFKPAVRQVIHNSDDGSVSFVRLELEREKRGLLPASASGALDPWSARAASPGDVLRDAAPVVIAEAAPPTSLLKHPPSEPATLPVRATVSSLQGFGADGSGNLSQTAVDLRGTVGGSVGIAVRGEYDSVSTGGRGKVAGGSLVAVDLSPGEGQAFSVSSRRQSLPYDTADSSRIDSHTVDWKGATGERSRASVSARLVSQANIEAGGLAPELFARSSSAVELLAGYQTDLGPDRFVRVQVGHRSGTEETLDPSGTRLLRRTRVGGSAGTRLLNAFVVEAGATGDVSTWSRGVTPELLLAVENGGLRVYGFASRRFEQTVAIGLATGVSGTDPGELAALSRSLYKAGVRFESHGTTLQLEASRRELGETYRLLLNPDFIDRIDSLYLFPGDTTDEVTGSATFRIDELVGGNLSVQTGRVVGSEFSPAGRNEASYILASAGVHLASTGTSLGLRYRLVEQALERGIGALRNDTEAVDVTLAQNLPVPLLTSIGSHWRALFSLEMGRRQEGDAESRSNRRMAGGLALSF